MYQLAKEVFAEDLARWTRIEDKAGRFLTVTGLMFAALTWLGQTVGARIIPPHDWVEWALGVVFALLFLALGGAAWFCFKALCFGRLAVITVDKKVFLGQLLKNAYVGYTDEMLEKQKQNRQACEAKVHHLEKAYRCLSAAFLLALAGGVLITAFLWQNPVKGVNP